MADHGAAPRAVLDQVARSIAFGMVDVEPGAVGLPRGAERRAVVLHLCLGHIAILFLGVPDVPGLERGT